MIPVRRCNRRRALLAITVTITPLLSAAQNAGVDSFSEEIVVTANRGPRQALDLVGNIARINEEQLRITNAAHPHEIAVKLPAVWISRGSGQEHLTAIRSPVLTGPGSCGAFLILEDGIPTRPAGFCNVNQLFELDSEQAQTIEVIRGPTNAMYGGNGLHGAVNVLMPEPESAPRINTSLESGPNNYWRGKIAWDSGNSDKGLSLGLMANTDDGFRDASGYDQIKGFFRGTRRYDWGEFKVGFSGFWLDQETAGSLIQGENAYKDPALRTTNQNPEAFRKADSQRLYARWMPNSTLAGWSMDYRAFLRRSDMKFRMHFVPDKSLEENGQVSLGTMITARRPIWNDSTLTAGVDLEIADAFLKETQEASDVTSNFGPTRPAGKHYDYGVLGAVVAPYTQLDLPFAESWELQLGLRLEYLYYDYDNDMVAGRTRADGTGCGAAGCLHNRPESRSDDFFNAAPNAGLLYRIDTNSVMFGNLVRGFRPPQATEVYRLQSRQNVADIDSETIDSLEVGYRYSSSTLHLEIVAFAMEKQNYILRDSNGFNVSDGKSDHYGLEAQFRWRPWKSIYVNAVGNYAKHTYEFNRDAARRETIVSGNEVDTAPQVMASARIGYEQRLVLAELEWLHMDSYFLDAANTAKYEGHGLWNLRVMVTPTPRWWLGVRVNNLTDKLYADRADFAFGNHRYFPGQQREVYVQLGYHTQ